MTDERRDRNEHEQHAGWMDRASEGDGARRSAGDGRGGGSERERGSSGKPALTEREKRERWPIG